MTISSDKSVLIIDDNFKTREMVKNFLVDNFNIYTAGTTDEVLTLLKKESFILIFMNYEMAVQKRIEFLEIIDKQHYPLWEAWIKSIFHKVINFFREKMLQGLSKLKKFCFN